MVQILVVTGSARPNSANSKVVEAIKSNLEGRRDVEVKVADLTQLGLPFMNAPMAPSMPDYAITDEKVKVWQEMVAAADGVVFAMPEYNHAMSALQKNAVDWLYKEWNDKPLAIVAYGFYAGRHAIAQFEEINTVIKAKLDQKIAGLQFGEDLEMNGEAKNAAALNEKLTPVFDELIQMIGGKGND